MKIAYPLLIIAAIPVFLVILLIKKIKARKKAKKSIQA